MPDDDSRLLDVRTSRIADRTAAIDDFVAAGYEVHVNLSPVVVRGGWLAAWAELLDALAAGTGEEFKQQAAAEVIFLTHNEQLHQVNLDWHPKAEELLWRPDLQQPKRSQTGGRNVRYRTGLKGSYVAQLSELLAERTPWLRIRYAF
jgi:spore photoproduct lyase